MKNIIVFGAGGMLGNYLSSYFLGCSEYNKVIGLGRKEFEVKNPGLEEIRDVFSKLGVDNTSVVINAIGIIPQAESPDRKISNREYMIVNGLFPHYLAMACSEVDARMFHVSTDCVFSGKRTKPNEANSYQENSNCDEENIYGLSKSLGEPLADCCSVVRSSLIGEDPKHGRSLLQWVLNECQRPESEINGYKNHFWNGITCLQLARILHQVIRENLYWRGVRHFFSPERISKYDLISIILKEYGLPCKVNPFSTPGTIDKCLGTLYELNEKVRIPSIGEQICETKTFQISTFSK